MEQSRFGYQLPRFIISGDDPRVASSLVERLGKTVIEKTKYAPPSLDSGLLAPPDALTPAPVLGQIESLPFNGMSWEDFERLTWRVLRDVTGHHSALIYGDKGESQFGLDVVAHSPRGSNVALQAKKYQRFGPAQLEAIAAKFVRDAGRRPFDVSTFIVAVSSRSRSRHVVDKLAEIRRDLQPVEVLLWDAGELSRLLRDAPAVVVEFFGEPTARRFCLPYSLTPRELPEADKAMVREALARSPEIVTGARPLIVAAEVPGTDPAHALALLSQAQMVLTDAGFGPHAAAYNSKRWELLGQLGSVEIAAQEVIDQFWAALDAGTSTTARQHLQQLQQLRRRAEGNLSVRGLERAAQLALDLYEYPLAGLPSRRTLQCGRPLDRAKLLVLAAETALVRGEGTWVRRHARALLDLGALDEGNDVLISRARLAVADEVGDWIELLADARTVRLGYRISAIIMSRWARFRAINESFVEADAAWDEATSYATLAGAWADAETFIFSRRSFRSRWSLGTSNELLPLQLSIASMGTSRTTVTLAKQAYQNAFIEQKARRSRQALIFAHRALRDAVVIGDWDAERASRQIVASILADAGELQRAAFHLAYAGDAKAMIDLGASASEYIDLAALVGKQPYWVAGSVYRLLAAEADLVPDDQIKRTAKSILKDVRSAEAGRLVDVPVMQNSRLNGALKALAGIAARVDGTTAEALLRVFENRSAVQAGMSRWSDESDATTLAALADRHDHLRQRSLDALVDILERAPEAASLATHDVIERFFPLIRERLTRLALAGNSWAQECVAISEPDLNSEEDMNAAFQRLSTPLIHRPGEMTVGTKAIADSLLLQGATDMDLSPVLRELLSRANDSRNSSHDRNDYVLAAANLVDRLEEEARTSLFEVALDMTISIRASDFDLLLLGRQGPDAGPSTAGHDDDPRHRAAYLAACLATTEDHRQRLRKSSFLLLVENGGTSVWATRALQRLGDVLSEEMGYLSGQGWALRVLAARLWANASEAFFIGLRLARDPEPRVRRSLAEAIARASPHDNHVEPLRLLRDDPHFSVRRLVSLVDEKQS
jgi:hypothetical protein